MEKVYKTYKKGDGFWFENVPQEWSYTNLNLLTDFIMGQAPHSSTYNQEGIGELFIKTGDFGLERPIPKWYTSNPLVYAKKEDVFMCVVGATAGKVNLGIDGTISRSIAALRPRNKMKQKFLYYYLQCNYIRLNDMSEGSAQGIINKDILSSIKIPIPSKQEQTQIAAYLDYHTQLIDNLISKKETLIQKLQEQRQAIINEAVTKGLNKNETLKDSGIGWLGKIPTNWRVTYLKRFTEKITDGAHHSPKTELEGKNYVSVKDVNEFGNIDLEGCKKISDDDFEILVRNGCQPDIGDVLLTKDGTIGRAAVVQNNDFVILSSLGLIRPKKEILNENYLRYFLISGLNVTQMYSVIAGAALTRLTIEKIKHLVITLPPLEEQIKIASTLDKTIYQMDLVIRKIKTSVKKLKAYRQSLISEAVTGKIDVRDWQPKKQ